MNIELNSEYFLSYYNTNSNKNSNKQFIIVKNYFYKYLHEPDGMNDFFKQLINIDFNMFKLLEYYIESIFLKKILTSITIKFLRTHFKFNERYIFWTKLFEIEQLSYIIIDTKIWNETHHKNIFNNLLSTKDHLSIIEIDKMGELFKKLLENTFILPSFLILLNKYINKFNVKTIYYSLEYDYIYEEAFLNKIDFNRDQKIVNLCLVLLKMNEPFFKNDINHLLNFGIINFIEEFGMRQDELIYAKLFKAKQLYKTINNRIVQLNHLLFHSFNRNLDIFYKDELNNQINLLKIQDHEFIRNYFIYFNHTKHVKYITNNQLLFIKKILNDSYNYNNSEIIDNIIDFIYNIIISKNDIYNYNYNLLKNDLIVFTRTWNTIFKTIIYFHVQDNINLIKIINKYMEILDEDSKSIYFKTTEINTINHIYITQLDYYFKNINETYEKINTFITKELKETYTNKLEVYTIEINLYIKNIYNIFIFLINFNKKRGFKYLLSYENRNIFIEFVNYIIESLSNNIWDNIWDNNNFDTDTLDIYNIFLDDLKNERDIYIYNKDKLKKIFLVFFEKFMYKLIETNHDELYNVYTKNIIEFNENNWNRLVYYFQKPLLIKLFITNIISNKIDEIKINDDYLDPLTYSLITDPIFLPNDIIIDKYTIYRYLVYNKENPFTRKYLDIEELEDYNNSKPIRSKIFIFKLKLLKL